MPQGSSAVRPTNGLYLYLTSKFVWTGPSSYKKRIYRAAVSQRLRNTGLVDLLPSKRYNIYTYTRYAAASPINITK